MRDPSVWAHKTARYMPVPLSQPSLGLTPCSTRRYPQCTGPLCHTQARTLTPAPEGSPGPARGRPVADPSGHTLTLKLHRPRFRPGARGGLGPAAPGRSERLGAGFSRRRTKAARRQRAPPASPLRAPAAAAAETRGPRQLRRPLARRSPLRGRSGSRAPARCCPPPPPPSGYRTAHINYSSPVSSFPGEANHRRRLR